MSFPASMVSTDANIQHLQTVIYFQRTAIENLKANLCSYGVMEREDIPQKNGKVMQFYENNIMPTNTTPITEGTVGAPISNGSVKGTVTLQQYADYMTFSDLIEQTAISPIVQEHATELGYRAARSVDKINYAQFDATAAAITAARIDLSDNEFLTAPIARQAFHSLLAADVKPKDGGMFMGIMHPLASFDYLNDNTAGGVLDLLKFNDYGRLKAGIQNYTVLTLDGIKWVCSTQVPTTANFPSSGKTGYHAYVVGKNAFFATSLGGTQVPTEKNFVAGINKHDRDTGNPTGVISSSAFYNFKYATYVPPDGIPRFRRVRAEASIT